MYRAVTIGGLGLNAINVAVQVEAYIESIDRLSDMVEATDDAVTVHLTTHGFSNNMDEDRQMQVMRAADEPHVLVNSDGIFAQIAGRANARSPSCCLKRPSKRGSVLREWALFCSTD